MSIIVTDEDEGRCWSIQNPTSNYDVWQSFEDGKHVVEAWFQTSTMANWECACRHHYDTAAEAAEKARDLLEMWWEEAPAC